MSFMQEQIIYDRWIEIDSKEGTFFIPQDLIGKTTEPRLSDCAPFIPCLPQNVISMRIIDGYGARLSAPGYLDCTEWTVFPTKEQAQKFLTEMYGDD